jgi:hypothetical protein
MTQMPAEAVVVDADPDLPHVQKIAEWIRKDQCVLFLGAGVHAEPPAGSPYHYAKAARPLRGGELAQHLAGETSFAHQYPKETGNLGRAAQFYEFERSRRELIDEIRRQVQTDKSPSPALRALASLDFSLIATTNYDQLLEESLREHKKRPVVSVYKKNPNELTDDYAGSDTDATPTEPFVLKIHGDINANDSIVITDEDYIHFLLRMRDRERFDPVPPGFRYQFTKYATLFIGYSLLDYNLRLLFKALRWDIDNAARRPPSYAVDPFPDNLIEKIYGQQQRFVHFIVKDVWSFVPMLYRELKGTEMPQ